ncbi:MAG: hypothetical protein RIG61_11950 [Deltaproteobacteria bacterium]
MKYSAIKYLSYAVLTFGFLYMTWHMGRAFERADAGEVTVNARARAGEYTECREMRREIEGYRRVYEQVLDELRDPAPASRWNNKYMEFTKR